MHILVFFVMKIAFIGKTIYRLVQEINNYSFSFRKLNTYSFQSNCATYLTYDAEKDLNKMRKYSLKYKPSSITLWTVADEPFLNKFST